MWAPRSHYTGQGVSCRLPWTVPWPTWTTMSTSAAHPQPQPKGVRWVGCGAVSQGGGWDGAKAASTIHDGVRRAWQIWRRQGQKGHFLYLFTPWIWEINKIIIVMSYVHGSLALAMWTGQYHVRCPTTKFPYLLRYMLSNRLKYPFLQLLQHASILHRRVWSLLHWWPQVISHYCIDPCNQQS